MTERAQAQPTEAQITAETIAQFRAERERPNLWIHLTEGECYQLLAGVVPESVKLACYESTEEFWQAKLQANAEKPEQSTKRAMKRMETPDERFDTGRLRRTGTSEREDGAHADDEAAHRSRRRTG